jgi:hypothetical protein
MDVSGSPCDDKNVGLYVVKKRKNVAVKTLLKRPSL